MRLEATWNDGISGISGLYYTYAKMFHVYADVSRANSGHSRHNRIAESIVCRAFLSFFVDRNRLLLDKSYILYILYKICSIINT
jgi:hypothetical protein